MEILAAFTGERLGWLNGIVIFLTILSTIHVMYFLSRIDDAIKSLDDITNENLTEQVKTHGSNTSGVVNRRIKTLQIRLGAQ